MFPFTVILWHFAIEKNIDSTTKCKIFVLNSHHNF